jgi:lipoprotein-releasing system ATP-binding protein
MLEMVGLTHRIKHKPRELSGGEMQRTAVARALVAQPRVLLADEPTGNLDKANGNEIIALLRRLNREQNLTIVMVTHDRELAAAADRTITLADGQIQPV